MVTPSPPAGSPEQPQPILTPLTEAAIFLVLTATRARGRRSRLPRRRRRAEALGRLPRPGGRADVRGRHRGRAVGSAARRATAAGLHRCRRSAGRAITRRSTPGRPAVPPTRAPLDLCFELAQRLTEPACRPRRRRRRGARLPLLRRARPARFRRRHREPDRGAAAARRTHRRRGPGVRRRQLRHRPEVLARSGRLGRALGRGAGARRRAHQARRHRTARRRQAGELARRAHDHHRPGRRGAPDHALQHAVRSRRRAEFGTYFIGYARPRR